jgi:hypothetical protein
MILLYSERKTKRLEYIVNQIFNRMLGVEVAISTDEAAFVSSQGCKINYSTKNFDNCLKINPHSLLFEDDIHPQQLLFSTYNNFPICFQTTEPACLPFDVFSASFYFLSRYEEYLVSEKDAHQRFAAKNSLAYKNDFLHLPLVDCWVSEFKQVLQKAYPLLTFSDRKFSFIPTYDVDLAYAYLQKGFFLQMAGYAKLLLKRDFKKITIRTKVLLKKEKDPFYSFDYLTDIHQKHQLKPCYFFIAAKRKSKYDRNPAWRKKAFQKLIHNLSLSSEIGLHASYFAKENPQRITAEKTYLQSITHELIVKNRFHFLRFTLPDSYQDLLANGITEDYSMGYADHIGFRASTCTPFLFFDLTRNAPTSLLLYPFLCMENAFSSDYHAEEIIQILEPYIDRIKKHNGTFTTLFHNHAFDEQEDGEKWKKVLEWIFANGTSSALERKTRKKVNVKTLISERI